MTDEIMIVDDSLTIRMDLQDAFTAAGLATRLCGNLAQAREAMAHGAPALVILDVLLPDGDGVDFLGELRNDERTARTPVLMLSAEAEIKDRIRGIKRGADEYVGKPYDSGYVVARAMALLRKSETGKPRAPSILVIDDSLTYREELAKLLGDAGFRVTQAGSGEEGLRRAADGRPDAIIVDGIMPGITGATFVRRLRLDPGLSPTPCLMLTASEGAASEVAALDAGADAYVRKDESNMIVMARLRAMLRQAEESRERSRAAGLFDPKRILAVDDSLTYLEALAEHLRLDGYEVVKAKSGEEALELLSVERVDCVLLDLQMPGLSGTETCKRIKGSSALRNVPLIMLTALEGPEAMVAGINAGADDYVAKSADFEVLRARLRAQLRRKQYEDENRNVREEIMRKDAETRAVRRNADARAELLVQVEKKNAELQMLNKEMQSFAYSVSHDLRQPLRSMDGFSKVLLDKYGGAIDDEARHYLQRIRAGAQRMGALIDGLLLLSRVTRADLTARPIDVGQISRRVYDRLRDAEPGRNAELALTGDLKGTGDDRLIETVLENLLGNAWKFTGRNTAPTRIEVGSVEQDNERVFFVRDNGVGFKMDYADKLFGPFQRLHSEEEFAGTGIGLATVQRIIHRHGGRIWAQAEVGRGATFYFSLGAPAAQKAAV
ncbi:MAG: response regulator [Planctomycetes bacterium]|nr:response regulator [Planctomycetota bacterium]